MSSDTSLTPIRRQYLELKARYPGAILFFRLGDFYETFDQDAELVARELEITLTSRPLGKQGRVPLAGVPYHAVEGYLSKLIAKGYRVAICEQLADPAKTRGIVPRGVVRVVTPGTVVEPQLLASKQNNYLVAFAPARPTQAGRPTLRAGRLDLGQAGIAYIDITTSAFGVTQLPLEQALAELERLGPAEVLAPAGAEELPVLPGVVTPVADAWFDPERAQARLKQHFGVATLEGYGCQGLPWATAAAGAVLAYLEETQPAALSLVTRLHTYSTDQWMYLDPQTRRNLELFQRSRSSTPEGSLLAVLDLTRTAMGGRMLRRWLERPLLEMEPLLRRQDAVEALYRTAMARSEVLHLLGRMPDLERLINRVRAGYATPRELVALREGLELAPRLREALERGEGSRPLASLVPSGGTCADLAALIGAAIRPDPPAARDQSEVIRRGFSPELDGLRDAAAGAQERLAGLERRERERTGIRSLKVGYNKVFGYYLEISNTHRRLVPPDYLRKQTLVGAERFYTPELKELEIAILHAQERALELEQELFRQVCAQVAAAGEQVLDLASALAELDCYGALAEAAERYGYVRPTLNGGDAIRIVDGRHPVVERFLEDGAFVPNDALLQNEDCQIAIITGPNMAGKSTYLRQVALIVLMAQIGSYVPAAAATIGLVDRIFTRVGAQDDLARGESTFMVEMAETANILRHATRRSLVVLDEIGRGTSTYDGISIARAVVELLHNSPPLAAKTLFATHYHELTALSGYLPRVRNFTFAVAEEGGSVVFLRRILPGGGDKSYGIHVARLAGLPESVVRRAEEVLQELEGQRSGDGRPLREHRKPEGRQLPLLDSVGALREELLSVDLNGLTPLEALNLLYQLQQKARDG
ncbi:MAG: DNA mismatch repair protein MutS [Chloroflexi bacterium]|nr:DNA mismatch repair protein MutS [Chloroflexota bacterium]